MTTYDYDDDPWELEWVNTRPPFDRMFKLGRCRRQDVTNKIARRLQFAGTSELTPETHQLLWDLYLAIVDAHELHNLQFQHARRYLEAAFDANDGYTFDDLREVARDRGLSDYKYSTTVETITPDLERLLVEKLVGPTKALVHSALRDRGR